MSDDCAASAAGSLHFGEYFGVDLFILRYGFISAQLGLL